MSLLRVVQPPRRAGHRRGGHAVPGPGSFWPAGCWWGVLGGQRCVPRLRPHGAFVKRGRMPGGPRRRRPISTPRASVSGARRLPIAGAARARRGRRVPTCSNRATQTVCRAQGPRSGRLASRRRWILWLRWNEDRKHHRNIRECGYPAHRRRWLPARAQQGAACAQAGRLAGCVAGCVAACSCGCAAALAQRPTRFLRFAPR